MPNPLGEAVSGAPDAVAASRGLKRNVGHVEDGPDTSDSLLSHIAGVPAREKQRRTSHATVGRGCNGDALRMQDQLRATSMPSPTGHTAGLAAATPSMPDPATSPDQLETESEGEEEAMWAGSDNGSGTKHWLMVRRAAGALRAAHADDRHA